MSKRLSPFQLVIFRPDLFASLVVTLVALPLCLGIALASGAPLFSGLIAGAVGGVVVGIVSKAPLSVSGPAAGLTVIVLSAVKGMPSFQVFTLSVMLTGLIQVVFSFTRAGILADFVPSSVVAGMLAAIGVILIVNQIPHVGGYDADSVGADAFNISGWDDFTVVWHDLSTVLTPGAVLIGGTCLVFLMWWDASKLKKGALRFVPGPLVVAVGGVLGNLLLGVMVPSWHLTRDHLVQVPLVDTLSQFPSLFSLPDFSAVGDSFVWTTAFTLAIVASLESLLSVKAVDEIDPRRRTTDKNRELLAQGTGNFVSGLIGGLPVTSVIVRSSANVDAGAQSKTSTILHGFWLLLSVALIPAVLNLIPLAALAAVLIATGYKLCKPSLFITLYRRGWTQFLPFIATVTAVVLTDLLEGILIGLAVSFALFIGQKHLHRKRPRSQHHRQLSQ